MVNKTGRRVGSISPDYRPESIKRAEEAGSRTIPKESRSIAEVKDLESDRARMGATTSGISNFKYNPGVGSGVSGGRRFKKGPAGIIAGIVIAAGAAVGFISNNPLISILENTFSNNSSLASAMHRRFPKVFGTAAYNDPVCSNSKLCKITGRISNNALTKLASRGITAVDAKGNSVAKKRVGYPKGKISAYKIDLGGGKSIHVTPAQLPGYLDNNPKIASKVFGKAGIFNPRYIAWKGNYMATKFFNKFNLKRGGGVADGKGGKASEKIKEGTAKLDASKGAGRIQANIENGVKRVSKAGLVYLSVAAGCLLAKTPSLIASGIAGLQLAQLLGVANDAVLSPGDKLKASAVLNDFSEKDAETTFTAFTEKTPRASDGVETSALDSPYLQAVMGLNSSKPPVSEDYAPGYSVLANPVVQFGESVSASTESACNLILNPITIYSAIGVQVAIAASGVGLPVAILNAIGSEVATRVSIEVSKAVLKDQAVNIFKTLATNDLIPNARGEAFGDVVGIALAGYTSSGELSRHLPVLSQSQVGESRQVMQELEGYEKQMDIASLSPFDTSSKHTFLGSIFHGLGVSMIKSGSYKAGGLSSILSTIMRMPGISLGLASPDAGAALDSYSEYCDYAEEFNLSTDDPSTTPAINMAGLPCTGLVGGSAGMDTAEAIRLVSNEGWLDETKDIEDGATIIDLVDSGYIKDGTPLYDYIDSCSNPDTGDYIFNSAGCIIPSNTGEVDDLNKLEPICYPVEGEEQSTDCISGGIKVESVGNSSALAAMPTMLMDFQLAQIINGEDDEEYTESVVSGLPQKQAGESDDDFRERLFSGIESNDDIKDATSAQQIKNREPKVRTSVLQTLVGLGNQGNRFTISSLLRTEDTLNRTDEYVSQHLGGYAFDIPVVNGVIISGGSYSSYNEKVQGFLKNLAVLLKPFGEDCAIGVPNNRYMSSIENTTKCHVFLDLKGTAPHIHVNVEVRFLKASQL